MLVWLLNRQAQASPVKSGLLVGNAGTLIGNHSGPFSLNPKTIQHTFISGRTGSGKTTLLLRLMSEHLRAGVPFVFIDFHGPATDELLAQVAACGAKGRFLLLEPWADPVIGL